MADKINPIRQTDDEAFELAGKLFAESRYASLGVREAKTGIPLVSRVAAAWGKSEGLFFCASDLSVHSQCLLSDPRCSIMLGEPGKGDGLAYPRITVIGEALRLANDHPDRQHLRELFIATHPKASLYVDFADFGFYPITAQRALLNGGFGKAYHLNGDDLALIGD